MSNKIGWTDFTWNPCWGCLTNCKFCYARKIAKRFAKIIAMKETLYREPLGDHYLYLSLLQKIENYYPVFLESHFDKNFPKKPSKIFVGSMSEIAQWNKEWMERVLAKIREHPEHIFQFLTKDPLVYNKYNFPDNCWLGVTAENQNRADERIPILLEVPVTKRFVSIEPIMSAINLTDIDEGDCFYNYLKGDISVEGRGHAKINKLDWVILGLETVNRKGKIVPKHRWIEEIWQACLDHNIPIYMKDNLKQAFPGLKLRQEFPEKPPLVPPSKWELSGVDK